MSTYHDIPYLRMMQQVISEGELRPNRTSEPAISLFSTQMEFDLSDGSIPLLTTKKVHLLSIIHELLWFLSGDTNIQYLKDNGVRIWNEWADDQGELGPVYGQMWRDYPSATGRDGVDQISALVHKLKHNPTDRRMIVTGWHPDLLPVDGVEPKDQVALGKQALPPCHMIWQCYVNTTTGSLSLKLTQRSADVFLGVPFNIAQYSILLHMLAHVCNLKPGKLYWCGGDVHVYSNLLDVCKEQIHRTPRPSPYLTFNRKVDDIFSFNVDDFIVTGYNPHGVLKGKVAV